MKTNPLKQSPYIVLNYCSSSLLQQNRLQSSANRFHTTVTQFPDCSSKLYQPTVEPDDSDDLAYDGAGSSPKPVGSASDAMPRLDHDRRRSSARMISARNLQNDRLNASGLMIRGSTFYARWMIPRPLQVIVGRSHFVKSLRTKNAHDARRLIRAAGWEYEELLRQAEGKVSQRLPTPSLAPQPDTHLSAKLKVKQKTFEQVFELFINDPSRKRAKKTIAGYRDGIEIIYAVVGRETLIGNIDREVCRRLLETLQWLPTNSPKKFPTLTAVQAAKMARQKGRKDLLGPVSVNGYMIMLSSILNFAINEELIDRNPCRGLRVIDPVKKRDKRLPFSDDQLRIIFGSPTYQDGGDEKRKTAKFWVPLIAFFTGMRLNEICALDVSDIQWFEGICCIQVRASADKSIKTIASERIIPVPQPLVEAGFPQFVATRLGTNAKKLFHEMRPSKNGHYSVEFSKWFARHLRQVGAYKERTCFHSFRHCFRDLIRVADIGQDIGLELGGWTHSHGKSEVHRNYGHGAQIVMLKRAIDTICAASRVFVEAPELRSLISPITGHLS